MKKLILIVSIVIPILAYGQFGVNIGIKAGVNFANITNASEVKAENNTGYMFGAYIAPKAKKTLSFRSELILSRQGYDYKSNTNTGNVNLDYLLLPQLITLNFNKFIQGHVGMQAAILLNAKVDSATSNNGNGSLLSYFKKFDYAVVAGADIFPFRRGLFVGARINVGLNNVSIGGTRPNFIPDIDAKNNVIQVYAGWRL